MRQLGDVRPSSSHTMPTSLSSAMLTQIIHCQLQDRQFTVSSGSIAEVDVAQFALNVLEGTKPAFDNRRHKYEAFPELT
jgi:hypothetical protein